MTKIAIVPNAAGTGTFSIEAPNSNSNRTLVLPDAAGELLTDVSSLPAANLTGDVAAARITTALNATGSAPVFAARAWVNFDGTTTTPTIRASGNVSSVTRNGTGEYTVNFTTAMLDTNYAGLVTAGDYGSLSRSAGGATTALRTTTTYKVLTLNAAQSAFSNCDAVFVAIFR
jgi:hypothetical protein